MEEVLQRVILENQDLIRQKTVIRRSVSLSETDHIQVLTGIRRCGKTSLLYQLAQEYDPERVLFIDFEDERLLFLNSLSGYDLIIDSYRLLYPDKMPVLFFDEIQNLNNWHLFLKRMHIKGFRIFVTGSNAHMISREIATYLKGISLETTVYPFDFQEFLALREITIQKKDLVTHPSSVVRYFREFMEFGGFPEVIKAPAEDKRAVAKNIFNLLFYKDLVARYSRDEYLLRLIVSKISENITKEFSITSLARRISPVYKASVPTITEYFNLLPEPFLTENLFPFRASFVQREAKRKTYFADNSFIFLTRVLPDYSRLFENLVFAILKRHHSDIYYYRTQGQQAEIDFYIPDQGKLIQACYSMTNTEVTTREVKSLGKAMDELDLPYGTIYTWNDPKKTSTLPSGKQITIEPLWKSVMKRDKG